MFNNFDYFEAILNFGTLSKAAKNLGISQPALSNYVIKLEEKLGVTIFDRSTSPIVLTEAGQIYYKYLKQSEAVRNGYFAEVGDLGKINGGVVTIGGASSVTACYLPKATTEFLNKYPDCRVRILDGVVSDIAKQAMNGEIDFFVTPQKQKNSDFEYTKLLDERVFLCVPEDMVKEADLSEFRIPIEDFISGVSPTKHYRPVNGALFKDRKFILLENGTNVRNIADKALEEWNFEPVNPLEVSQMLTGFNLCVSGVGITFMSESILMLGNFSKMPAIFALDENISYRSMYVGCKKSRYLSSACLEYIAILKHCCE